MDIQQTSEKDTTTLMNKYNFVKPVTVTVIYEEDEEKVKEINIGERNVQNMPNQEVDPLKPTPSRKAATATSEYAKYEETDNYNMLLKVAQNMSNIVEAYNKYIQCLKRNEKEAVHILKFNYIHTKSQNYRRSFEVAIRLLLPHKTNERLRQFLVQKVIEISKVKIDSKYVEGLCNDLIFWTEEMIDNISAQSKFDKTQKVSNNLKRKSNQVNVSKESKVTIFSAGQKGNEVILSVDALYLHTALQKDDSNKRTNCRNETSMPELNVSSTSINTTSSSELKNPLQADTQSNSQKHYASQSKSFNNVNLSNMNNLENSFYKSIPKSCATNDANPLIRRHAKLDTSNRISSQHNSTTVNNRANQEQDTMSRENGKSSLSFQALMDQMNSALYPQSSKTGQRASNQSSKLNFLPTYSTNNAVTHNNKNTTASQYEVEKINQNILPAQNTTLGNMANYPSSMPLQYNTRTSNVTQTTNLHCGMITVNSHINQNYENRNFTNTLPGYQQNYCNNYMMDRRQQTNQQYMLQNTISRDISFMTPVTYNPSPPQMNLAAFQDRPNWFNI
ncbi:GATA zinc finger domain-containing protein 14 [Papilio machaon]|uniref:GATA zinc finger domain-containing protein 14 n=1 Tax=Papilio machaon TaxID=76193 RepID=UPI001E66515D|nr:GATA zinc finger domain-containing protein 14 [Papilio machaon]